MSQQFLPWDPMNPMNKSMYLEDQYPLSYEEVHNYVQSYPNPANPNMPQPGAEPSPQLKPQPAKDSWYYSNDGRNDGHISTFEKIKAFVKGGTYNLVKGMFCDENGFSWKRTLLTAGAATAIALTGAAGLAVAGTLGLVSAADNFLHSAELAKNAKTDQDARDAYEGIGESASTAGLSLWAGWKGFKGLAAKWFHKAPKITVPPTGEVPPPTGEVPTPTVETPTGTPEPFRFNNQLALPSPADVRARMIADGQFNLPAVIDKTPALEVPATEPIETVVKPVKPKRTPKPKTAKTKTAKPRKPRTAKKPVVNTQARSYTDRIYNIETNPNPDVEYFYYGTPTKKLPDGWGEANHYFG